MTTSNDSLIWPKPDLFTWILYALLAGAVLRALFIISVGVNQPLLDIHDFRQTQTALSVYWMLHGGPWLAYETPVAGAPWAIPFEFPLYHWIVALVAKLGIPLDAAGRGVSAAFTLATLGPLYWLFRITGLGRTAFIFTAILYLSSPQYLYWGRTFLMETCTVFFSVLALAMLASTLKHPSWLMVAGAFLAGTLALLSKATTFPPFALIGGCLLLLEMWRRWRAAENIPSILRAALVPGAALVLPFLIAYAWIAYADEIKSLNAFGANLTSKNLFLWNYGTMAQRLSPALWVDVIGTRSLKDLFGAATPLIFMIFGATLMYGRPFQGRLLIASILAVVGFLTPFLIFTNLHMVHNYYQTANGIFLLAAVGLGLAIIATQEGWRFRLIPTVLLLAIVTSQTLWFQKDFNYFVVGDIAEQNRRYHAATFVRNTTPENGSIIVFGDDWSSVIPYYAQRKGIVAKDGPLIADLVNDSQSRLGDRPLAAVILCRGDGYNPRNPEDLTRIEAFVSKREKLADFSGCEVYSGSEKSG